MNTKKAIGVGIIAFAVIAAVIVLGTVLLTSGISANALFGITVVALIIGAIFFKRTIKFVMALFTLVIILGMGSCFYQCSNSAVNLHKQYMAELREEQAERAARFPVSGKGKATKDNPVKCYIDPLISHSSGSGQVRYCSVKHPGTSYLGNPQLPHSKWAMPSGNYLVYPEKEDEVVDFSWWQQ